MRSRFRVVVGLALVFGLFAIPGLAAGAGSARSAGGISATQAYFVQLDGQPSARGGSKSAAKAARDAFYKNAAAMGVGVTQREAFDTLWNGVSVNVSARDAGALATVPGVRAVYPVNTISLASLPSGTNPEPAATDGEILHPGGNSVINDVNSSSMIGADIANASGETGQGVKVAIVDSGVDYNHPDLGGCLGTGCKVAGGWDFVGDTFDSEPTDSTYQPVAHPDADPAPCDPNVADQIAQQPHAGVSDAGHGTHVAGIVAAKAAEAGGVTGVAPDATILAYRVFGCNGSTSDDIIIAALERAYKDGAQVVNMSLGDAFNNFASSPDAQATQTLVDNGVVVVAASGNSGANGLFSTGAPSVAPGAISVASVNNLAFPAASFDAVSGATVNHVAYATLQTTVAPPTSGTAGDFVYVGRGCVADSSLGLSQDDPYLADPNGKVALIIRGVCTFNTKYARAVDAGAKAVVIMNDGANAGRIGLFFGGSVVDKGVPGVTISFTDGQTIRSMITAGTTSLNWTANTVEAADPAAGQISSFSSWGFASDLALKPDVAAPGGNIRSTWPLSQDGGYNVISGTSMASPHVAGAVADYLQAHPGSTPAQVKSALSDTAVPIINTAGARENPALEGDGLIRVDRAIASGVTASPSNISLGDGHGGSSAITLTNNTSAPIAYTLGNNSSFAEEPFLADGTTPSHMPYTFAPFFFGNNVTFSAPTVTVPANGTASVTVTIAEPGWDPTAFYGGFIRFTPATGQQLTVPYAGYVGDYQAISPIASGDCSLPMLAHLGSSTDSIACDDGTPAITGFTGAPSGGAWNNQTGQDPVVLLYHLDYQVQELRVTLVDATTGQPVTQGNRNPVLSDVTGVARNATVNGFNGLIWDGTSSFVDNGNKGTAHRKAVPAGTYKLLVTATKVKSLTDSRQNQTQSWTSPAFTLVHGA